MATLEDIERIAKERKEAEQRNPLLKLDLGDLVKESQRLAYKLGKYAFYNDIKLIPLPFQVNYILYQLTIQEFNRREIYARQPGKIF